MKTTRGSALLMAFSASLVLASAGSAQAQLKIDFGQPASRVQSGYEAWVATHETAADFTNQTFSAFGTNVTVGISFNFTQPEGMQMIERPSLGGYNADPAHLPDLMYEWTGVDPRRTNGLPAGEASTLTLTLTGLPAGKYSWLSYHHDTDNQSSGFTYAFDDALLDLSGSGDITDNDGDQVYALDATAKLNAAFYSDGVTPVTVSFSTIGTTVYFFFVMNGFEIESQPDAPSFAQQPQAQMRILGVSPATNTFEAVALSLESPVYQWRRDGAPLSGETNSTLVLVDGELAGYDVIASNSVGSVTSVTATLSLGVPPINEGHQSVSRLDPVTFSITMPDGPAYTYQWFKDGSSIPGATSNSYGIARAYGLHSGSYTVYVTLDTVSIDSLPHAELTVETMTYVRATHGTVGSNTFNTASGSYTDWGTPLERPGDDDLWGEEETQVYSIPGGGMWSWESSGPESSPGLTTVVTGLVHETYSVYALWAGHGRNRPAAWDIMAALSGNTLRLFNENNSTRLTSDAGIGDVHLAYLGAVTGTGLSIDIDDTPTGGGVGSTDRTRYIGVAYEPKDTPDVTLTAPVDEAAYAAGSSIPLSADASSPIGEISKVEFFAYDTKIGEAIHAPYTATWSNAPAGYYPVIARATDSYGQTADSAVADLEIGNPPQVMLLTYDASNPTGADPSVIQHFRDRGARVRQVRADSSVVADADGMDFLVISSTIMSGDGAKYRDVTIPVLHWEQALQDEFEMSHSNGTAGAQMSVSIVDPEHAMAAGLSGTVDVYNVADGFSYGIPTGVVEVVATVPGDPERAVLYGYESGAEMENGLIAPARRAFIFLDDNSYDKLTPEGLSLFDAAVDWALDVPAGSRGTVLILR